MPRTTPKTKLEVIPPTDEERDTFQVTTTPLRQIFPKGSLKFNWLFQWIPCNDVNTVIIPAGRSDLWLVLIGKSAMTSLEVKCQFGRLLLNLL